MIATTRCKGGREQVREYLIEAREKAGLTQQDVANRIGISRQYYQMVETGERQKRMDLSLAGGLSVVLNTSFRFLLWFFPAGPGGWDRVAFCGAARQGIRRGSNRVHIATVSTFQSKPGMVDPVLYKIGAAGVFHFPAQLLDDVPLVIDFAGGLDGG